MAGEQQVRCGHRWARREHEGAARAGAAGGRRHRWHEGEQRGATMQGISSWSRSMINFSVGGKDSSTHVSGAQQAWNQAMQASPKQATSIRSMRARHQTCRGAQTCSGTVAAQNNGTRTTQNCCGLSLASCKIFGSDVVVGEWARWSRSSGEPHETARTAWDGEDEDSREVR